MPAFDYQLNIVTGSSNETLISILMIDTILLCGKTNDSTSNTPNQTASEVTWTTLEAQLSAVAATSVPYIIVAGHYPVWSIGKHGPTKCLVDKLRPLLHKYGVSAYLSGHEHNLQHLQDTFMNRTVDYFVSGCSTMVESSKKGVNKLPLGSLKFHWGPKFQLFNGGLVVAQANKKQLTLTFYKTKEKSLYQTVIQPRF